MTSSSRPLRIWLQTLPSGPVFEGTSVGPLQVVQKAPSSRGVPEQAPCPAPGLRLAHLAFVGARLLTAICCL